MIKQSLINRIENRYNPNHDVPEGVQVTWVDACLLEIIKAQQEQIEKLQKQVKTLMDDFDIIEKGFDGNYEVVR